jgi:hypothetical protein
MTLIRYNIGTKGQLVNGASDASALISERRPALRSLLIKLLNVVPGLGHAEGVVVT